MKLMKKSGMAVLIVLMLLCFGMITEAAYTDGLNDTTPIMGYPLKKSRKVVIYRDESLTVVKKKVTYREFTIIRREEDAFYVNCKVGSKKVKGWVKTNVFFDTKGSEITQSFTNTTLYLYKDTVSGEIYKTVPQYKGGATVGKKGDWYQVLFYMDNAYYLGWMTKNSYASVRLSMDTTEQVLADGYYKISSQEKKNAYLESGKIREGVLLRKNKTVNSQIFQIKFVAGKGYLIKALDQKAYLSVSDDQLVIKKAKMYWDIIRYEGYFVLQEKENGKALCYEKGSGVITKKRNKKLPIQHWTFTKTEVKGKEITPVVFSQYDPKWGGSIYCNGYSPRTIASSGCGVVSLVNAIYHLNGQYISPVMLANFSNSRGHYVYMQGTLDSLYPDFAACYGEEYGFTYAGRANDYVTLRNHLLNGGTAIALVPGHYMAVVDYRPSDNTYLVLDSAITGTRPTTTTGDWIYQGRLTYGSMGCYYFHLFSAR